MRTLVLLRHAKSSWDDPGVRDFARVLAPRGRRDAPKMGLLLRASGVEVEQVLCSTAVRARETLELVKKAAKYTGPVEYTDEIYEASYRRLLDLVRKLSNDAKTALLVGHNPGFEDLVRYLCSPNGDVGVHLPTAALVCIDFDMSDWSATVEGSGALRWLAIPKMLGD
jgi:phosphohistidine phosphatase